MSAPVSNTPVSDLFAQLFEVTAYAESFVAGELVAKLVPALQALERKVNGLPPVIPLGSGLPSATPPTP